MGIYVLKLMLGSCAKANFRLCQQIPKFQQAYLLLVQFAGCAGTETERSGQTVFTKQCHWHPMVNTVCPDLSLSVPAHPAIGIHDKGGKGQGS